LEDEEKEDSRGGIKTEAAQGRQRCSRRNAEGNKVSHGGDSDAYTSMGHGLPHPNFDVVVQVSLNEGIHDDKGVIDTETKHYEWKDGMQIGVRLATPAAEPHAGSDGQANGQAADHAQGDPALHSTAAAAQVDAQV